MDATQLYIALSVLALLIAISAYALVKKKQREKLRYEFMMLIAHKLRTPMTQVKWTLSALFDDKNLTDEQQLGLSKIKDSNERLINLLDLLLSFSRTDLNKKLITGTVDLSALTREILSKDEKYFRNNRIRLSDDIEEGITVRADKYNLSFLIRSLLSNAVEYTKENGSATVEVSSEGREAILRVINTGGIEIQPEEKEKIFTPFFRTEKADEMNSAGLGMSLYVSKQVAKAFKGDLTVGIDNEAREHKVIFTLTMPVAPRSAETTAKQEYAQSV